MDNAALTLTRVADMADFEDYYRLKCDTEAINWSGFATAPDYERLRKHFAALIESDKLVYFLRCNGRLAGYCQISFNDGTAEVDGYSVLSEMAGKGLGTSVLSMTAGALDELTDKKPERIIAWVSENNKASLKCFERNGFVVSDAAGSRTVDLPALGRSDRFILLTRDLDKHE